MAGLIEILSTVAGAMTMTRRTDEPEEGDGAEPISRLAKQMAPMVVVSLMTAAGVQFGPVGANVEDGRKDIQILMVKVSTLTADMTHLHEKVQEISNRRTLQVESLEKRILSCELEIAKRGGRGGP
jgi:hypothetical protein